MSEIKLNASTRTGVGKNKVDKMRVAGNIPAVVYAKGSENRHVEVSAHEFEMVLREAGMTTIVNLDLDGTKIPVLIKDIQNHPFKRLVLHVDFQEVRMDQPIKLSVPIHLLGRDEIKLQPSVLMQQLDELDIECLPMDIPERVEYDVKEITFDAPVMVKDLDVFNDDKITIFNDADDVVCSLMEVQEVVEEEGEASADVPTVSETEEGEE